MVIFNITFKVDNESAPSWMEWAQSRVLPLAENEAAVTEHKLLRLLSDDPTGVTYCIQHTITDTSDARTYEEERINPVLRDMYAAFAGKMVHFSTLLEVM